jgi:hypothetical protein
MTPKERDFVAAYSKSCVRPFWDYEQNAKRACEIIRRLDAECRRQRKSIQHLKNRLKIWTGE